MAADQHYHFDHVWQVPRPRDEAWSVLADIDSYAHWWPQVRRIVSADEVTRELEIRSVLPVTLRVRLRQEVADQDQGILRAALSGDMVGTAQWTFSWEGETTTAARWVQDVELTDPRLRALPAATRGALRLNHTMMMRAGEAGLRRWLERTT